MTSIKIVWKFADGMYYCWCGGCASWAVRQETPNLYDAADFSDYWDADLNEMTCRPPDRCGRDQAGVWVQIQIISNAIEIVNNNPTGPGLAAY